MKTLLLSAAIALGMALPAQAAQAIAKITDVHLCCGNCVKGANAAISKVEGVTANVDQDASTITLIADDTGKLQKAADALIAAGYFGKTEGSSVKLADTSGAKGEKVQSLKVEGVHLCCGKCVTTVDEALKSVAGVKSHTAVKNAKTFDVTGDFNDEDVFAALQKAGLTGKVGK